MRRGEREIERVERKRNWETEEGMKVGGRERGGKGRQTGVEKEGRERRREREGPGDRGRDGREGGEGERERK